MLRARHAPAARAIVATLALGLALTAVACGGDDDGADSAAAPIGTTAAPSGATAPATTPSGATSAPSGASTAPSGASTAPSDAATAESTAAESTAPPPTEKVTIALDWTANVNYLGIYAAIANGYFEQQGIEPQDPALRRHARRGAHRRRQDRPRDQLSAGRHHQPRAGPGVQGRGGPRRPEHDGARGAGVVEVPEPEGSERRALRRLRHPERQGAHPRHPEGGRGARPEVRRGRAQHGGDRRPGQGAHRVLGRLHGHRRRHGRAAGREAAPLPVPRLPGRGGRLPERRLRRERRDDRRARRRPEARAGGAGRGLRVVGRQPRGGGDRSSSTRTRRS